VLLWASAFPAIAVADRGLGPAGLAVARLVIASAALALAALFLGVRRPRRRDLPLIALCGLAGMTGYQLLLNAGERVVPAGTASLLVATAWRRRRPGSCCGPTPWPGWTSDGSRPACTWSRRPRS
jgi:drug/metabolite transporter (DMT)-like permease